jgi:hypothetical protein
MSRKNPFPVALKKGLQKVCPDVDFYLLAHLSGTLVGCGFRFSQHALLMVAVLCARRRNFGFERVKRLKESVGDIDLRQFAPSEYAGKATVINMKFIMHWLL